MIAHLRKQGREVVSHLINFSKEASGAAVVEFALVVPLMLALFFLTLEATQALEANRRVGRLANQVADLVTQQKEITKDELLALMMIGRAALEPYRRSKPTITVTAIQITDEDKPKPKVVWSRSLVGDALVYAERPDDITELPDSLLVRGRFLVRAEANLDYRPMILWSADGKEAMGLTAAFDNISMSARQYYNPRQTPTIPCGNC
ncbi:MULTISPECIES: TadE/TadG family type IV pilus assembly protein [Chelativorans]|uniref:TadE-like domain-containing protein n=1 Tax=Chelativorans sp. (strain BNC1) TaxID=266779 RepID=Q11AW0_CHESB|nr:MULTISPECIES: TadE/TadG family type IV pilus assembly protein [Chelativorans]